MSANKRGSGIDYYLQSPLFGNNEFNNSPGAMRETNIQRMLQRVLSELAMNRFKYENLPESVDERFLELTLLFNSSAVWYWDEDYDKLLAVRGAGFGAMNFYDNPVAFQTIGPGNSINIAGAAVATFLPKTLSAYIPTADKDLDPAKKRRKAVGMYPNYMRTPDIDIVMVYSTRLATIDRTLEINTKNARRNKVVTSNVNNQLSVTNLGRQQDEGVEVINVKDGFQPETIIQALDLGITPESYDKLSVLRARWWNEAMGLLGIDNANQDKKERLVAAEVGANDAQTDSMRFVALQARRQALEYINDIWGLEIKVDYNVEIEAQADAARAMLGIEQSKDKATGKPAGKPERDEK
jgi:hypothetical protein